MLCCPHRLGRAQLIQVLLQLRVGWAFGLGNPGACSWRCVVRGHTARPWNDLADAMARHALTHGAAGRPDLLPCHNNAIIFGGVNWAWLTLQLDCYRTCFPPAGVPTSWHIQLSLRRASQQVKTQDHPGPH